MHLLENLGLSEKKDISSAVLSGGMRRRLNLACALMHEPEIIILDEPTTGLDPATRIQMWNIMKQVVTQNKATFLLTTYYIEEAEALCERIAFVNSGQVVAEGGLDELKKIVGHEIAKIRSIPGTPEKLIRIIKSVKGVSNVTPTEHRVIVEDKDMSAELPKISTALSIKK